MILVTSTLLLWAALHLASDTPIGRIMHKVLVSWPAGQLSRITIGHVVTTALLLIIGAGLYWLMREEAIIMLGLAAPEILAWASMFELSMVINVFTFTVLAASGLRVQGMISKVRSVVQRSGAWRARTGVRMRSRPRPCNDDDEGPDVGIALRLAA